jgi:SAM-dependent methyltransferase
VRSWSPLRDYNYPVHRLLEESARRHLANLSGRVLDVGCGSSPYRRLLPSGVSYVGVDRHPSAAVRADLHALPFGDGTFDGALCTEVLEMARRPWVVLGEIARVLRSGGLLYVTAPFDWHILDGGDYFRFTPAGLTVLLEDAGLRVQKLESVGGVFTATAGKLVEGVVHDVWLPAARAVGIKRGTYLLAALATLPWNLTTLALSPLDRLGSRSPLSIAAVAVRG